MVINAKVQLKNLKTEMRNENPENLKPLGNF